jgi:WD40 repeat protein
MDMAVRYRHKSSRVVSGSGAVATEASDITAQVWGATTGECLIAYRGHGRLLKGPRNITTWRMVPVFGVAWSPDGGRIASASYDTTVQVWNSTTGRHLLTYSQHTGLVYGVAWSPDGKQIASASDDKTVQVWEVTTGQRLLTYQGHTEAVYSVAWSPDGRFLASASANQTVQVWQAP